jgi:hypothetical protein
MSDFRSHQSINLSSNINFENGANFHGLSEQVTHTIKKYEHCYNITSLSMSVLRFAHGRKLKFFHFQEALEYIAIHCLSVHGEFTPEIAKMYIPFCSIYQKKIGRYISMKELSSKNFSRDFKRVSQRFSHLFTNKKY